MPCTGARCPSVIGSPIHEIDAHSCQARRLTDVVAQRRLSPHCGLSPKTGPAEPQAGYIAVGADKPNQAAILRDTRTQVGSFR